MGILSSVLGYAGVGLLTYIGYHSFKAYKEYKENDNRSKKGE